MTHFINVCRTTDVWLRAHYPTIGKLTHAARIGDLHPLDCIYINT